MPQRELPRGVGHGVGPRRSFQQREADLVTTAQLYLQGLAQVVIAATVCEGRAYKLTRQQIAADIKAVQARWLKEQVTAVDERKTIELAKIDNLERVYWETWERSIGAHEVINVKQVPGDGGGMKSTEASVRTELLVGDLGALSGVQWCIERRCKLLGLDAPQQFEGTIDKVVREYVGINVSLV